jgi:hypothetical protein
VSLPRYPGLSLNSEARIVTSWTRFWSPETTRTDAEVAGSEADLLDVAARGGRVVIGSMGSAIISALGRSRC